MGRRALINDDDLRDEAHLDLLNDTERKIVEMRWGLTTGSKVTQREAAKKLQIKLVDLRVIENQAAIKIQRHVNENSPEIVELAYSSEYLDLISDMKRRIEELETIVSAIDAILPYVKTARKPVKRRSVKS